MARLAPLLALLLWLLVGCGKDPATPGAGEGAGTPPGADENGSAEPGTTAARTACPTDPAEALAWVRAARTMPDEHELRRRLAAWPLDNERFLDTEESQVVLTWRITVALQDGSIERAVKAWKLLLAHFDGHGVTPEGRGLTPDAIRRGLIEEARLLTRRRGEGTRPNRLGAESAWKAGADLLRPDDEELGAQLERSRRWALWDSLHRWLPVIERAAGPDLGDTGKDASTGRPFVIVVADHFALGEVIFADVLARWMREGEAAGLRGVLMPIRRGEVRMGVRRVPVPDPAEEHAALAEAAARARLTPAWTTAGLLAEPLEDGAAFARAIGLEGQEAAILIVDRRGRIVARMSGMGLDPRPLDPVIQKLVSR